MDYPPGTRICHLPGGSDSSQRYLARFTRQACVLDLLDEVRVGWSERQNDASQAKKDRAMLAQRDLDSRKKARPDDEYPHLSAIDVEKVPTDLRPIWREILHSMPMPRTAGDSGFVSAALY